MKIVHICLNGPFTDGWSYQENLLSKYHVKLGCTVTVICSKWIYNKGEKAYCDKDTYINDDGVKIIRLDTYRGDIDSKFKKYKNLRESIALENPDILFVHGVGSLDNVVIAEYCDTHPDVVMYVDNHADFSNSATNWFSKNILHKLIWKHYAKIIEPYTKKFYGVLPARVDFLSEVYGLPQNKCELLVMGADDELVEKSKKNNARKKIRLKYGIKDEDFLIVTGGKIDIWKKQILKLLQAVKESKNDYIKLIFFGSIAQEIKLDVEKYIDEDKIKYIGWIDSRESYDYFEASDLVVFPGRHSVFWEQVTGQGVPMLVKDWPGTHHVDLGGNVQFVKSDSSDELKKKLEEIFSDPIQYKRMKFVAENRGMKKFSYREIAKISVEFK